jgi:transposase
VGEGRYLLPSAAILDSQSVKYAAPHKKAVGFDGCKKVNGRKRHILLDTMGLVIMVVVPAASYPERQGARKLITRVMQRKQYVCDRLARIWVDAGYTGENLMCLLNKCRFVPVPKRWLVERTFGWFNNWRRLIKDYEILPETTEAFIYIS